MGETPFASRAAVMVWAITLLGVAGGAQADMTIGRWCDRILPGTPKYNHIMTLSVRDDGSIALASEYGDGSAGTQELRETGDRLYAAVDNELGEKYRIVPATGNLQMLDADGLIRVAYRLENSPQNGECAH